MSSQPSFKQIPIVSRPKSTPRLDLLRSMSRTGFVLLLILIPVTGVFRIDVSSGFVVFNHEIWFSDFFIVFGFWLAAACLLIIMYSSLGTVFCGWACPQNTFSTWANRVTARLLGKRALINWGDEDQTAKVSSGKNHWHNWLLLGLRLLAASMLLALLPMLYFLPPDALWAFLSFGEDPRVTGSLYWIYSVFVFITGANIALIRHYVCRYMCIYRMWQHLFRTRETLHIEYDAARQADCEKCSFCVTVCPVDIDPRQTATFDACINCGECITACDNMHKKNGTPGLLSFKFGRRLDALDNDGRFSSPSLLSRVRWVLPVLALALGLLSWGIVQYQPYHLSVYRAEMLHGDHTRDYRINLANKLYAPAEIRVQVEGVPPEHYFLSGDRVEFSTVGRKDLNLRLEGLPKGLHTITVRASGPDGWQGSFRFQHLVEKG